LDLKWCVTAKGNAFEELKKTRLYRHLLTLVCENWQEEPLFEGKNV
jgi:hypothetical protein